MVKRFLYVWVLVSVLAGGGVCQAQSLIFSTFEGHKIVTETVMQVMTEAYRRIGITIDIKRLPGERAIHCANDGKVDGELFRKKDGIEQIYTRLIKIPVCIHHADFVVFTKKTTLLIRSWEDLLPYTVGYKRGVKAIEMNLIQGTQAQAVASIEQAFQKISRGRTDLAIDFRPDGLVTLKKLGLKDIHVLEPPIIRIDSYHYLHVKNRNLVAPLTTALQQMECEGLILDIQNKVEQRSLNPLPQ